VIRRCAHFPYFSFTCSSLWPSLTRQGISVPAEVRANLMKEGTKICRWKGTNRSRSEQSCGKSRYRFRAGNRHHKPARRRGFTPRLRDECLNGEIFYSLKEAQIVIEQWRQQYNTVRSHAALGYRPPAPGAYSPVLNPGSQPQVVM
jgi:Integrase core domain